MANLKSRHVLQVSSLILMVLGAVLLGIEVYNWSILPNIDNKEGLSELITLYKYKENTYKQMFFWTIVLMTGVSFWISKKVNLLFYQVLLTCVCLILLINLFISYLPLGFKFVVFALVVFIVIVLQKQLNKQQVINEIKKAHKTLSIVFGVICSIVYMLVLGYFG